MTIESATRLHKPGVGGSSPPAASQFQIDHGPAEEYHRRPGVSCSQLKLLRESPVAFYWRYIAKSSPPASSDALSYGTLLHTWAELTGLSYMRGERTDRDFWQRAVRPEAGFVTAAGALTAKGKEWAATLTGGEIVLCPADEEKLRPQTKNLLENPKVVELLIDSVDHEFNISWKWNGHDCRARVDGATHGFLYDWKTTRDKYPLQTWWRSALEYGYHLQSAMYQNAALTAGWPSEPMRFIITSTVWPYECAVRWLPAKVIEAGRKDCLRLLEELRTRTDFDVWHRTDSHECGELYFPAYALKGL